ncbi:replication initiator [Actinomadura madurae]|uniref:replication initiator n=1 Tax=Actinomadura madurae TaxID=1993 RepID=UPI003558E5FC
MRRVDLNTGAAEVVYVPCNHTLASVCPSCAERKRKLRAVQCSQGWHLTEEPVITRADPDEEQRAWMGLRAHAQAARDRAAEEGSSDGEGPEFWDAVVRDLDNELERTGVRGALKTGDQKGGAPDPLGGGRTHRTFPGVPSTPAPSARCSGAVTARRSGRRSS